MHNGLPFREKPLVSVNRFPAPAIIIAGPTGRLMTGSCFGRVLVQPGKYSQRMI